MCGIKIENHIPDLNMYGFLKPFAGLHGIASI